jgi:hypothetical protein
VFDAGDLVIFEDRFEIDLSVADRGMQLPISLIHIFDMPNYITAGLFFEPVQRF